MAELCFGNSLGNRETLLCFVSSTATSSAFWSEFDIENASETK